MSKTRVEVGERLVHYFAAEPEDLIPEIEKYTENGQIALGKWRNTESKKFKYVELMDGRWKIRRAALTVQKFGDEWRYEVSRANYDACDQ